MPQTKQKEKQSPSRRDRIQESLNTRLSILYLAFAGSMLATILILFGVGVVLRNPIAVEDYLLGTSQSTIDYDAVIMSKYLSKEEDTLVFPIEITQDHLTIQKVPELIVTTQFIGATNAQVKTELIQGDRFYYEFRIQNLPETWQAVRLEVAFEGNEGKLLFDFSRVPKIESYTELKPDYLFTSNGAKARSVQVAIRKAYHQFQTELPEKMKELEEEKNQIEEEIIAIQNETKYLTETEKTKATSTIFTLETQQSIIQGNLSSYQRQLVEAEEKVQLLNQKLVEVIQENDLGQEEIALTNE